MKIRKTFLFGVEPRAGFLLLLLTAHTL